jgi:hypothetical protein
MTKLQRFDRRALLKASMATSALLATGALPGAAAALFQAQEPKRRLILVAFAGGVRSRETFGSPANIPNLCGLADGGVFAPRTRTANLGHYGAALSIFTGVAEARGIRENGRGPEPTLFEYLRRDAGLDASDVWISTSGGAQQTNYAASSHADYGPRYGANVLDGDGIFNREFRALLDSYGDVRARDAGEAAGLRELREVLGEKDSEQAARIEKYILDELTRGTSDISGPGAADQKAIRVGRNLFTIFKPAFLGVVLQSADIAHGDYNGYVEVIRRNDAAVGELWAAVQADAELAATTSIIVLPEFGRDRDLNSRRGLDHGDGSDDLRLVTTTFAGPAFKRGVELDREIATIDICPTIMSLFGTSAPHARGKRLSKVLAPR